jgi:adenylate cyclase
MGADESGTLSALRHWRDEVLTPGVAKHRGRVVKHLGDGALVEFASAVDAVACALEAQTAMSQRDTSSGETVLELRTGVNVGEIVVENDDIYGDGVNVAARLQEVCVPGGLCVSAEVHRLVAGKVDAQFDDGGAQSLKNIVAPVHVWRWQPGGAAPSISGAIAEAPQQDPDRPSIVVLPFDNMSADEEQEYFVDGMTEDIITDLSKISGLFVIARNTSFTFKGRAVSVPEACTELAVRYALEGSVRKAGKRVRINAQLIDGQSGGHVWADRFDRDLDDIFALQDEVTQNIVDAMKVALTPREQERQARRQAVDFNVAAYELTLRARHHYYRFTPDDLAEAHNLCKQALEIDPTYAKPLSLIASVYLALWFLGRSDDAADTLDRAIATAREAIALDPDDAEAQGSLGFCLLWKRQHDEALAAIDVSVAADPNNALAHARRAMILTWRGELDDALPEAEASIRLDPNAPFPSRWALGHIHMMAERYNEALDAYTVPGAVPPGFAPGYLYLAATYEALGRHDEAVAACESAREVSPLIDLPWARELMPYKRADDLERLLRLWESAGLAGK